MGTSFCSTVATSTCVGGGDAGFSEWGPQPSSSKVSVLVSNLMMGLVILEIVDRFRQRRPLYKTGAGLAWPRLKAADQMLLYCLAQRRRGEEGSLVQCSPLRVSARDVEG